MLSLGYGCGLRAGEIVRLKDGDIDSAQMIIRMVQSKGRKDRHVMLPPELLLSLRQWWKVRPTRFDAGVPVGQRWLFPGRRQGQHLTYRQLSRMPHALPGGSACIRFATRLRQTCSRRASISVTSRPCSKHRHTARQQQIEARIWYPFHPRCGEMVPVFRRFAYRGVDLVVIPQPDGSIAWIPEWMTEERASRFALTPEPQFSLENLRLLRATVDALLNFLPSDSTREKDGHEAPQSESRKPTSHSVRTGGSTNRPVGNAKSTAREVARSPARRDRSGARNPGGRL